MAPNAHKPFVVHTTTLDINVLGTCFNVMAYTADPRTEVTLVSGKVDVNTGECREVLHPAQQFVLNNASRQHEIKEVDVSAYIDWKEGILSFKSMPLEELCKRLGRWYNIEFQLIQGAGSMGLYACAIAKEKGVTTIVIDSVAERLEVAREFGADHLINMTDLPQMADREAAVKALTGGRGTDAAVEVTGVAAAVEEGLHHLAPMGRYVIIGTNTLSAQATLSPGYITRKSLTVTGVARYLPEYLHKSLVFLDKFQHKYPFDNFSSMTFDLNDLEKGLEMVANRKVIRAVVESGDESNA